MWFHWILPVRVGSEFTDSRDANTYSYRLIGTQVWMTENLAYLPSVVGPGTGSDAAPKYYVYSYERDNVTTAKTYNEYIFMGIVQLAGSHGRVNNQQRKSQWCTGSLLLQAGIYPAMPSGQP